MTVTQDWQMEYAGLLIGDPGAYSIAKIDGLASMPDLRTSDRTRLRRHGMLPGDDFLAGRSVIADVEIDGADDPAFAAAVAALKAALAPGSPEQALTFQIPGVAGGGVRRLNARPRKLALPVDLDRFFHRLPVASVEWFATDPRIYDDAEQSEAVGLAAGVAGLSWPLSWPLSWGGASTSSTITAANAGTFPTPMVVRFDGPVTNPGIENVVTGFTLQLSLTLGLGEFLEVDTDARTVLLSGTASRYSSLTTADWFELAPGDNQLRFIGTTTGDPTMTVTWRSAWI